MTKIALKFEKKGNCGDFLFIHVVHKEGGEVKNVQKLRPHGLWMTPNFLLLQKLESGFILQKQPTT